MIGTAFHANCSTVDGCVRDVSTNEIADRLDVCEETVYDMLKAHALLPILPWKVGRSADLKERNVVDVRGFPLGAFKATNVGKVVSTFDHDDEKDWDHVDFVVDAQLSPGNSGSPVLAVSCKTGEPETRVRTISMSLILSVGTVKGSSAKTTKSANFPGVIDPLMASSCEL